MNFFFDTVIAKDKSHYYNIYRIHSNRCSAELLWQNTENGGPSFFLTLETESNAWKTDGAADSYIAERISEEIEEYLRRFSV